MTPDDTPQQELEDLVALVSSPGWSRFRQFAAKSWGLGAYRTRARQILEQVKTPDQQTAAAALLMQLEVTATEVEKLFAWVDERVRTLQHRETVRS